MSLAPIHRYIGRIVHLIRKEKGMRQSELALLTGLKQPNLSRIENGLVSPRQVTLEKIAKALGVEVGVFYSESKVQEVERKWAASLGPKHAALMLAGKLAPVALLDTSLNYPEQVDATGEPQGPLEVMLQLPPLETEGDKRFALRVRDDSMQSPNKGGFAPGDVVVFSNGLAVKDGDYAFVLLRNGSTFRKVFLAAPESVRLVPLNPNYQERTLPRSEVRQFWRLMRQLRNF
jgi:transcriptional regulator with XRE-family HTH domain